MKCPRDGAELVVEHKDGVEIDFCPACRGVWLDRGELDKFIEKSRALSEHDKWSQQIEERRKDARDVRHKVETNPVSDFLSGFFMP